VIPYFGGTGNGDNATGMSLAMGLAAALFDRTRTGKGRVVEVRPALCPSLPL
jgi:crotonobetainyl-CoA:carnitine CoA-transferase CaiB-like acyl-CoA transferase